MRIFLSRDLEKSLSRCLEETEKRVPKCVKVVLFNRVRLTILISGIGELFCPYEIARSIGMPEDLAEDLMTDIKGKVSINKKDVNELFTKQGLRLCLKKDYDGIFRVVKTSRELPKEEPYMFFPFSTTFIESKEYLTEGGLKVFLKDVRVRKASQLKELLLGKDF